jgi:5-methylcytosine-specific restriction endonuclease McrA
MSEQETSVPERSEVDEPRDTETGARTPALDVRPGSRKSVPADESMRSTSAPSGPELRYRVQFTADQAFVDLLEEARNLLQHELPGRDLAEVQRRALELLVNKLRQRKHAATERPRSSASGSATRQRPPTQKSATRSRHIPAEVRRSVWQRDGARCTYVDARGQRCREQSGLEFHHRHPHARGGPPSLENITLHCRSHNELAAEQDFGRDVMRERRAAQRGSRAGAAP